MSTVRALAVLGNAESPSAWSGIPCHFFRAARESGFLTSALNLTDRRYALHRLAWHARQLCRGHGPLGYQNSLECARRMWKLVPPHVFGGEILSHFQTFPFWQDASRTGTRFSFYCDATLRQWWGGRREEAAGRRCVEEIIAREGEGYKAASRVIGMSAWCARSFVADYGVPPHRVFVVRPGCNMDETAVGRYLRKRGPSWRAGGPVFTPAHPARIGFIGMDYRRKGLRRLVDAAGILHGRGLPVQVAVVGNCDARMLRLPFVKWHGCINKHADLGAFLSVVDSFAIGCLPSHAEPLGISTLECLRLGVPVCGARVGGIPDCISAEVGFLFSAHAGGEEIADALQRHVFTPDVYARLVTGAEAAAETVTWAHSVRQLERIWAAAAQSRAENEAR